MNCEQCVDVIFAEMCDLDDILAHCNMEALSD